MTSHAPTVARRGPGDRTRPLGDHTKPRGPATSPRLVDEAQWTGHAPTVARQSPGDGLAPTAARRVPGDRRRPHVRHMGRRGSATHPRRPDGAQKTGDAPMAARLGPEDWPYTHCARRGPGEWPRLHGGETGLRKRATPPRRPEGAQGTGHAPTAV